MYELQRCRENISLLLLLLCVHFTCNCYFSPTRVFASFLFLAEKNKTFSSCITVTKSPFLSCTRFTPRPASAIQICFLSFPLPSLSPIACTNFFRLLEHLDRVCEWASEWVRHAFSLSFFVSFFLFMLHLCIHLIPSWFYVIVSTFTSSVWQVKFLFFSLSLHCIQFVPLWHILFSSCMLLLRHA